MRIQARALSMNGVRVPVWGPQLPNQTFVWQQQPQQPRQPVQTQRPRYAQPQQPQQPQPPQPPQPARKQVLRTPAPSPVKLAHPRPMRPMHASAIKCLEA